MGELLLLTTDTGLSYQQMLTLYQKRWGVEDYHKTLKQSASLECCPARSLTTQTSHILASVCGFIKLESLKLVASTSRFALKGRL